MASIQYKKSKSGKKTYYVVVSLRGKHKWLKAGAQPPCGKKNGGTAKEFLPKWLVCWVPYNLTTYTI